MLNDKGLLTFTKVPGNQLFPVGNWRIWHYHLVVVFCAVLGDDIYPFVTDIFEQLYYGYLVKQSPGVFWDTCPLTSQPLKLW